MSRITLKLMADYGCFPFWWFSGTEQIGCIDPNSLKLDQKIVERFDKWIQVYNSFIDWDEPNREKIIPQSKIDWFENEGVDLWQISSKILSNQYNLVYFSNKYSRVFYKLDEYNQWKNRKN